MSKVSVQKIVLCDIDGTVADNNHRQHLLKEYANWDMFFKEMVSDKPIPEIINLIRELEKDDKDIVFVTGRPERYRVATSAWLDKFVIKNYLLIMRSDKDVRHKLVVKRELIAENIELNAVLTFFENDKELVLLWKEMGLNVVDVNVILSKTI